MFYVYFVSVLYYKAMHLSINTISHVQREIIQTKVYVIFMHSAKLSKFFFKNKSHGA